MQFSEFLHLPAAQVRSLVQRHAPVAVAIPFNGTRRWYMATYQKQAEDVFSEDYLERVLGRMLEIMGMMFADGVRTIYTPIMGRALMERGEAYMEFGIRAIGNVAAAAAQAWYAEHQIEASAYGQLDLLPAELQQTLAAMSAQAESPTGYLRYGVFADQPLDDLLQRTVRLYQQNGTVPSGDELMAAYYGGLADPITMWIGADQPTVFDVPLVLHEATALYFLQFPTLYLDIATWRRLLYDSLFVRGDEETLYPDNLLETRQVAGLGVRRAGGWQPSDN